jgi:hypothetical protein
MTYASGDFYPKCPDCIADVREIQAAGNRSVVYTGCGLTKDEHLRIEKAREQAEIRAREIVAQAREHALQSMEKELLPRAILHLVYEEAERNVRP